jgi:hypothetical protein
MLGASSRTRADEALRSTDAAIRRCDEILQRAGVNIEAAVGRARREAELSGTASEKERLMALAYSNPSPRNSIPATVEMGTPMSSLTQFGSPQRSMYSLSSTGPMPASRAESSQATPALSDFDARIAALSPLAAKLLQQAVQASKTSSM